MRLEKEKIKAVAAAVLAILFIATAYVTFFKGSTVSGPPARTGTGASHSEPPGPGSAAAPLAPVQTDLTHSNLTHSDLTLEEKGMAAVFKPEIRDMFKPPAPLGRPGKQQAQDPGGTAPPAPPLSPREIIEIKDQLAFKGVILHGAGSVAIINDAFYHVGDAIGPYKIVSISDTSVRIGTPRGHLSLEMIHDN